MGRLYGRLFGRFWSPYVAVLAAGILSAFYFAITGTQWAVTGEFTRFGGHFLGLAGIDASGWAYFEKIGLEGTPFGRTGGWIVFGMLAGALVAALLGNDFKLRLPSQRRRLFQGFAGGAIAGFGARLALGCNLAAFFTGVPQFSFHAWIFMVTTGIGTYFGVKVIRTRFWRGRPNLSRLQRVTPSQGSGEGASQEEPAKSVQPLVGAAVGAGMVVLAALFAVGGQGLLAVAALFGVAFGVLIQRGQICFTSAFRDLWVSGRATMSKALAVGMMAATVLTFIFIQTGANPAIIHIASPGTVIGGLLFGFGIVLAGGCETGMMYRAMEGQVHFGFVFLGNIVGATVLAFGWDHLGIYGALSEGWPQINLVTAWGPSAALLGTLALLAAWFLFSVWWERHYRYGKGIESGERERSAAPKTAE